MEILFYYTREDIIRRLQELGAAPKLLRMPAVVEELYNFQLEYPVNNFLEEINMDSNGCITFDRYSFELRSNDKVFMYKNRNTEGYLNKSVIDINDYGIQIAIGYSDMDSAYECDGYTERNGKYIIKHSSSGELIFEPWTPETVTRPNHPGYKIEGGARTGEIGYMLKDYPEVEEWYVENGFLPLSKETRDKKIVADMEKARKDCKSRIVILLNKLKEEVNEKHKREPFIGGEISKLLLKIEIAKNDMRKLTKLIRVYSQGERPTIDISNEDHQLQQEEKSPIYMTTEEAEYKEYEQQINQIIISIFRGGTEPLRKYEEGAKDAAVRSEALEEPFSKLMELARNCSKKCARIPFKGKNISETINIEIRDLENYTRYFHIANVEPKDLNQEVIEAYREFINLYEIIYNSTREFKMKKAIKELKRCLLEQGKVPFVGKMILREVEELSLVENNKREER